MSSLKSVNFNRSTYTDTCSEENPFQQFWVTIIIIVGQQQIPKIFGKKLILLDPSNASCWMFSDVLALLS